MLIKLLIYLSLIICLLTLWMIYNNKKVYEITIAGLDEISKFLDKYIKTLSYNELLLYDPDEIFRKWIYSYNYLLWHPWISSAIRPEHAATMREWYLEQSLKMK